MIIFVDRFIIHSLEIFFTGSIDGHLRIFDSAKFILKDDIVLDVFY